MFHAESGKKKTAAPFILTPNRTKKEQDVLWLHPGSSLTGKRFKNPNPLQECGLFLSPGFGSGPLGARRGGGFLQEPIVNSASSDNINARCCVYVIRGFCHSCALVVFATLRESFEKRRPIETSIISLFHRRKVQRQKQTIKDEMASINQPDTF